MKKAVILSIIVAICFGSYNFAFASIEKDLSIIDNYRHTSDQFLSILNTIRKYYPEYTNQIIGDWIAHAYKEVRKELPDITIYEVARDIKGLAVDSMGRMKFNVLMATYIVTRPME